MKDVERQVDWAEKGALIVAARDRRVFEVTGEDRLSWLNGLLTCELKSAKAGDAVYGFAVAQKGKILSDVHVVVAPERVLLVVRESVADDLEEAFDHHLMMEDAAIHVVPGSVLFVHGPRSGEVLDAVRLTGALGGQVDLLGIGGAVMVAGPEVRSALEDALEKVSGGVGDEDGWDALRVLHGFPELGADYDGQSYPQETALEKKAVSFQKGCYLGQEVVCMLELRGHVKRRLVQLDVAYGPAPARGGKVRDEKGNDVGEVTTAVAFPGRHAVRALAMVKYAFIEKGTVVDVGGRAARVLG